MLRKACELAFKRPGHCLDSIEVGDYDVQLRFSRPQWKVDGQSYRTLDVVHIGWIPLVRGESPLALKPIRGAVPIWEALEKWCREKEGVHLRVECVFAVPLRNYLMNERGFQRQDLTDDCFIKVLH